MPCSSLVQEKQLSKVIKSKGTDSNQAMKIKTFLKKAYNINEVLLITIYLKFSPVILK